MKVTTLEAPTKRCNLVQIRIVYVVSGSHGGAARSAPPTVGGVPLPCVTAQKQHVSAFSAHRCSENELENTTNFEEIIHKGRDLKCFLA